MNDHIEYVWGLLRSVQLELIPGLMSGQVIFSW